MKNNKKQTPKSAIRKFCIQCVGSYKDTGACKGNRLLSGSGYKKEECLFYPYRNSKGRPSVKTIRKHCLDCMSGSRQLVRACINFNFPVYTFRMGTNPTCQPKKVAQT